MIRLRAPILGSVPRIDSHSAGCSCMRRIAVVDNVGEMGNFFIQSGHLIGPVVVFRQVAPVPREGSHVTRKSARPRQQDAAGAPAARFPRTVVTDDEDCRWLPPTCC